MADGRHESIVRRVERLEREVRRWRRGAAALGLAAVAVVTIGAAVPRGRVVEAQKFVLKDASGRVRAELGPTDTDKEIALRFRDTVGLLRVIVGLQEETSLLVLSDKTGRPRAGLVTLAQGAPAFTLYDTTGRPRVELGLAREGEPHAALLDARGGSTWKAP
jgi:hypothetical protein